MFEGGGSKRLGVCGRFIQTEPNYINAQVLQKNIIRQCHNTSKINSRLVSLAYY